MGKEGSNGSELHRLKKFENLDEKRFDKLYKACLPIIRKLSYNIDTRKYGVSRDIIQSYFSDKFMYVYNKYQDYDDDRLKYTLIKSMTQFRNKLYESGKEWEDDSEETEYKEELSKKFHAFMQKHLSPDEYLLFVTQLNPPPFLEEKMKESHGRISILALVEFFDLPKTIKSQDIISDMRANINHALQLAAEELSR